MAVNVIKVLGKVYCALEFVVALLITTLIVSLRVTEPIQDRTEYLDVWEVGLIGLAWIFFISLPVLLIYLISFFRAITLRTARQKAMMAIHVLNVALWGVFYLALPKSTPCSAAEMESHYLSHHDEIHRLIAYTKQCLNDSTAITYEFRNGQVQEISADSFGGQWDFCIDNKDSVLLVAGITPEQFDTINAMMRKAGIIGININRNGYNRESRLIYRYYGSTSYQYVIDHDTVQQVDTTAAPLVSMQTIVFNDSVYFQCLGGMVCHHFPDHDQYLKKTTRSN